jgi:putative tryptophan/tyrosine transport system substrate-binding protein
VRAISKYFALCTLLLALASNASAQAKKVFRIGVLSTADPEREAVRFEAIRQALRERGYIEGQNTAIEYRYPDVPNAGERAPALAAELVRLKVDIILVTGGDEWVRAAKNATKTIPIVMMGQGPDPVKTGLVESLARPGGNITGVTNLIVELGGKRLEVFKEAVPKLSRVAVLYDPSIKANMDEVKDVLPNSARAQRLALQLWEIRAADDLDKVFAGLIKQRPDGLYLAGGPLIMAHRKRIADSSLKSAFPSMYVRREFAEAGGLMTYGADIADAYRLVATYVDKILKGAKPADLPVQQPSKFEMVINLKTARQIGVTIPQSVLYKADKVIK